MFYSPGLSEDGKERNGGRSRSHASKIKSYSTLLYSTPLSARLSPLLGRIEDQSERSEQPCLLKKSRSQR